MYPYIELFGKTIPMYGVMILLGTAASLIYIKINEGRRAFPSSDTELALIYTIIGLAIGAKVLYLLSALPQLVSELHYVKTMPQAFFEKYLLGGFVFYGGLYGALIAGWLYCRINQLRFFELCQLIMPAGALFHAFGRLGCFFMGCCYGCPSEIFGFTFTHSEIAPNGVPLLPVQLIEAVGELILFAVLAVMARQEGSGKRVLQIYLAAYGVMRFVLEFFRGDEYRGFLGPLSLSQVLSVVAIGIAVALSFPRKKKIA